MKFVRSIPSRVSLPLLLGLGAVHAGALTWFAYQRNVVGNPMAFVWEEGEGLRQLTRVEWVEKQARSAYRRAAHDPSNERWQTALKEKLAKLQKECEDVGINYDAVKAEMDASFLPQAADDSADAPG